MMPPGAFPPPFGGFPGMSTLSSAHHKSKILTSSGRPGMPPPPFGIPPPGAPGAPGMLPRMSYSLLPSPPDSKDKKFSIFDQFPANQFPPQAPGAHGLPFPPPFPNATGTPPTGGFPPPLPNMPQGMVPPPGGFPNFPIPPPGAGFPPMPQPGMAPGGPSPIPTGPRGLEGYPPPPGNGPPPGMDQRW
jgi:U1 small nuclear ribonucleoprotein C